MSKSIVSKLRERLLDLNIKRLTRRHDLIHAELIAELAELESKGIHMRVLCLDEKKKG